MRSKKKKERSASVTAVIQRASEPLKCEESGKKEALLSPPLKKIKVINLTTTDKEFKGHRNYGRTDFSISSDGC